MRNPQRVTAYLNKILVNGPLRFIGEPLYKGVIGFELALHRIAVPAKINSRESQELINSHLTAVIKTFERPAVLRRLLASIRKYYPDLTIIVVDDGRNPEKIDDVETVILPYNQGLAAGRNEALKCVKTNYFLLLDDDFVFYHHTDLKASLEILEANPEIDIVGGEVVNLPFFTVHDYSRAKLFPTNAEPTYPPGTRLGGLPVIDIVANFFIGRTKRVQSVGWDPNLKKVEHSDFFTRAKGVLTTAFNQDLKILHAKTPFDAGYMLERNDVTLERAMLLYRYDQPEPPPENN